MSESLGVSDRYLSHWYLIGYLSHWYLIGLFVVTLALILRHREDCSVHGEIW